MAAREPVTIERLERGRQTLTRVIRMWGEDGRRFLPILARLNEEIAKREREDALLAEAHRIAAGEPPGTATDARQGATESA